MMAAGPPDIAPAIAAPARLAMSSIAAPTLDAVRELLVVAPSPAAPDAYVFAPRALVEPLAVVDPDEPERDAELVRSL